MAATIPGAGITTPLTLTTTDNTDTLTLVSTDTDANYGPNIEMSRPVTGTTNDLLGRIDFSGQDAAGNTHNYASIEAIIDDATSGGEEGRLLVRVEKDGSTINILDINGSEVVINEDSKDYDFRVESDHLSSILHVNAGLTLSGQSGHGAVGIGKDPAILLDVEGDLNNDLVAEFTNTDNASGGGGPYGIAVRFPNANRDNNTEYFYYATDSVGAKFAVWSDGDVQNHDNSYGSLSDERIKQDIRDANSQWDDIKAVKVRNFKKKDDVAQYGDKAWEQIGVIAQELEASGMDKLVKKEVLWDKDHKEVKSGEATEGDIKEYKSVKYSVLYMKAIKALQEAMARIEALEAK